MSVQQQEDYNEFGCQRSIKTHTRQRWGYTDKARLRGLKAKTDFYQPDLVATGFLEKISADVAANLRQNPGFFSDLSPPNPEVLAGFIHQSRINARSRPWQLFLR
ncbi:MAG: hypothetical protein ACRC8Y_04545 [Chroococcales cyanobacterium]